MYRRWENDQKGGMTEERRKILLEIGVDFSLMESGPRSNLHANTNSAALMMATSATAAAVAAASPSSTTLCITTNNADSGSYPDGMPRLNRVSKWDAKFHQLQAYKIIHGHTNIPRRSKRNPSFDALGEWVHFQRRQFRNLMAGKTSTMTIARKKALEHIQFQWSRGGRESANSVAAAAVAAAGISTTAMNTPVKFDSPVNSPAIKSDILVKKESEDAVHQQCQLYLKQPLQNKNDRLIKNDDIGNMQQICQSQQVQQQQPIFNATLSKKDEVIELQ